MDLNRHVAVTLQRKSEGSDSKSLLEWTLNWKHLQRLRKIYDKKSIPKNLFDKIRFLLIFVVELPLKCQFESIAREMMRANIFR